MNGSRRVLWYAISRIPNVILLYSPLFFLILGWETRKKLIQEHRKRSSERKKKLPLLRNSKVCSVANQETLTYYQKSKDSVLAWKTRRYCQILRILAQALPSTPHSLPYFVSHIICPTSTTQNPSKLIENTLSHIQWAGAHLLKIYTQIYFNSSRIGALID
jgi:hypothetical protein